ncbi:hypothetical protein SK271_0348 [Streptococcus mitis]|uniref:Uncharacterized protein n=1 Tax=Streptococcus mitis TaxID=28037 RepID=A0A081QX67_STRMT|nr:hypothetical protein SK608_0626 [Streptococcus mitis]KER08307.1 hypothetical protein SK271_0348 [Streptococcus mitis]
MPVFTSQELFVSPFLSNFHYPLCISLKFSEKRVNWYARSLFRGV